MTLSNEQLTAIYNKANGITDKNPPISTKFIFNAMQSAYAAGLAERVPEVWQVNNKVFSVLFATEAQADKFIGASSPATGIQKRRLDVLQPEPKP